MSREAEWRPAGRWSSHDQTGRLARARVYSLSHGLLAMSCCHHPEKKWESAISGQNFFFVPNDQIWSETSRNAKKNFSDFWSAAEKKVRVGDFGAKFFFRPNRSDLVWNVEKYEKNFFGFSAEDQGIGAGSAGRVTARWQAEWRPAGRWSSHDQWVRWAGSDGPWAGRVTALWGISNSNSGDMC